MGLQYRPPSCLENEDGSSEVLTSTKHLQSLSDKDFKEELSRKFKELKESIGLPQIRLKRYESRNEKT